MGSLVLLALSLSLDAGTAAICCGLSAHGFRARDGVRVGLWFGLFQAGMTLAGAAAGSALSGQFARLAAVVSFGLLLWLGLRMILDALAGDAEPQLPAGDAPPSFCSGTSAPSGAAAETSGAAKTAACPGAKTLAPLAVATSLDALAAGVGIPLLGVGVWTSAAVIGGTAFAVSFAGSLAGRELGRGIRRAAGCLGGAVLIGIGVKILLGG